MLTHGIKVGRSAHKSNKTFLPFVPLLRHQFSTLQAFFQFTAQHFRLGLRPACCWRPGVCYRIKTKKTQQFDGGEEFPCLLRKQALRSNLVAADPAMPNEAYIVSPTSVVTTSEGSAGRSRLKERDASYVPFRFCRKPRGGYRRR